MSDLKTLIKELKETQKAANQDLASGDPRTLPGRTMARNAALEKVSKLEENYKAALLQSVFTLLPIGSNSGKFAELANEAGAVVVDGSEFYKTLAKRCQQTMGANVFGLTQFMALNTEVKNWAKSNKVDFTSLNFSTDLNTSNLNDIVNVVRELVEKDNGQRLVKTYIEGQVVTQSLEQEVDSKVVPVVILNTTQNEQASLIGTLFRGKGLTIETDNQEVNSEFITKTFQSVKKVLKGN